jgi:hypothetical protein
MSRITTVTFLALCSVALAGCAAHPEPIIDMKGVDQELLAVDWEECEAYSEEVIMGAGIARGSATGAAVGAIAGVINGGVGRTAANGALYGGTRSGLDADKDQQRVFKRCMSGRGYRVLN